MSPFVSPLSAIARAHNPTVIGSVAFRKGPRWFCPHRSDRCHALILTCRNHPCGNIVSAIISRGSHICIACRNVCDWGQESWSLKIVLDRLIAPFRGSWLLDFTGVQRTKVAMPSYYLRKCVDRLILVAQNSSWSLDQLKKRMLITWFHFDPGRKHFYRRRVCDYPLCFVFVLAAMAWSIEQHGHHLTRVNCIEPLLR